MWPSLSVAGRWREMLASPVARAQDAACRRVRRTAAQTRQGKRGATSARHASQRRASPLKKLRAFAEAIRGTPFIMPAWEREDGNSNACRCFACRHRHWTGLLFAGRSCRVVTDVLQYQEPGV